MSTVILLVAACCGQSTLPKPLLERASPHYAIDNNHPLVRPSNFIGTPEEPAGTTGSAYEALKNGRSLAEIGRYQEAITAFDDALAHDSRFAQAYAWRCKCHHHLGDREKTLADLRSVILCPCSMAQLRWWSKVSNDLGDLGSVIAYLSIVIDEIGVSDSDLFCSRGRALKSWNETDNAIGCFTYALEINPVHRESLFRRAWAYLECDQVERGKQDLAKLARLDPDSAEVLFLRGLERKVSGDIDAAFAIYNEASDTFPNDTRLLKARALTTTDLKESKVLLARAIELDPHDWETVVFLGTFEWVEGDLSSAEKRFEAAALHWKYYPPAHLALLALRFAKDDFAGTLAAADEMHKYCHSTVRSRLYRGCALLELGREREAGHEFARLVDMQGDEAIRARAYAELGHLLAKQDEFKLAEECYSKAIGLAPNDDVAYEERGNLRVRLGDTKRGEQDLAKAKRLQRAQRREAETAEKLEEL